MFILYSLLVGLVLGWLLGGRISRLGDLRFHWKELVFAGLLVQVFLFSDPVAERIGSVGPVLYVGSTLVVVACLFRNRAVAGIPVVALGAISNMAAIVANGGYMPAGAAAAAALGKTEPAVYSNSSFVASPVLEPLTDIFALPTWLPFANIFSIGDILIGIGVAWVIVTTMRGRTTALISPRLAEG